MFQRLECDLAFCHAAPEPTDQALACFSFKMFNDWRHSANPERGLRTSKGFGMGFRLRVPFARQLFMDVARQRFDALSEIARQFGELCILLQQHRELFRLMDELGLAPLARQSE